MPERLNRLRALLRTSSFTPEPVVRPPVPGAPAHPGAPFVPRVVADSAVTLTRRLRTIARPTDAAGRARLARLTVESALGLQRVRADAADAVPVRVVGPERTVWLRPRSHDATAFEFLHEEPHHLPPPELTGPVRHIAVFGANIGLLLADLGDRFPAARLLGVEPDPGNAAVARRNLERFDDRCELVEAAVAEHDGTLTMRWGHAAWGLQHHRDELTEEGVRHVPTRAADSLLAAHAGEDPIDYVLVNIESAWYDLLRAGRWTRRVRSIKIEVQDHYDEVVPMLESLGFRARLEPLRWGAFAVGVRP